MKTKRTSKAERGYALIKEAAFSPQRCRGAEDFYTYELERIAKAINPDVSDGQMRLVIMDDYRHSDGYCMLTTMTSAYLSYDNVMRVRLAFFRAEACARCEGTSIDCDIRLALEFPRAKNDERRVWIDVETGLPWRPRACEQISGTLGARPSDAKEFHREATGIALREIGRIQKERSVWVGWEVCYEPWMGDREAHNLVSTATDPSRPAVTVLCTCYHPKGQADFNPWRNSGINAEGIRQRVLEAA